MLPAAMRSRRRSPSTAVRDEQKRLMVIAGTDIRQAGQEADRRATFRPCLRLQGGCAPASEHDAPRWRRRASTFRATPFDLSSSSRDQRGQIVGAGVLEHAARRAPPMAGPPRPRGWQLRAWSWPLSSRRGLLFCSMVGCGPGSSRSPPTATRNPSRSRSRMCCSLTVAPAGTDPPRQRAGEVAGDDGGRGRVIWCCAQEVDERPA